jgi:hypothetical protein
MEDGSRDRRVELRVTCVVSFAEVSLDIPGAAAVA